MVTPLTDLLARVKGATGNRSLGCVLAEMDDVAAWIERTKPQGLLYDSCRLALTEAAALIRALVDALEPFAQAGDDLDETDKDDWSAWEHHVAMSVKIGDFRLAAALLSALVADELGRLQPSASAPGIEADNSSQFGEG